MHAPPPCQVSQSVSRFVPGAEDLKGHIMKHRGDLMKNSDGQFEGQNVNVILEQAEHELKHGDPEVNKMLFSSLSWSSGFILRLRRRGTTPYFPGN